MTQPTDAFQAAVDPGSTPDQAIANGFERTVARHSGKPAIEAAGASITFDKLNRAANAVAARLGQVGDGEGNRGARGVRIALLFDNRIKAIASMLGVLKQGHAYIPLDARDPDERLRFILTDSQPSAVLTDTDHIEQARRLAPPACDLINISELPLSSVAPPLPHVSPDAIAYWIYTSGSTGRPKGVCQTHRNVQFFARCYRDTLRITESDRLSLLFTLSFSAANMHIYNALLTGATLCAYDLRRDGLAPLATWLRQQRVTVVHTVPSVFRQLARSLRDDERFDSVRAVDLGGETVYSDDVRLFRRYFHASTVLVNHLGATEASVMAQHLISVDAAHGASDAEAAHDVVPVGRSPAGVHVRIVKPDGSDAAPGEVGEIVVSSPYLSPGYSQPPPPEGEAAAAAFADDPARPGWRTWRAGDRGRFNADGDLIFLGRTGSRVKLRGQSVDLSEVEGALRQCDRVVDAVATAQTQASEQEANRLIAYVQCGETDRDEKHLRESLARRLPSYMMPSAIVFLDALPRTATGKIDRTALPPPTVAVARTAPLAPPVDDIEAQIAAIFARMLNLADVSRDDDFFLVGGDSLTVMSLHVQLVDRFGGSAPDVLDDTTVAGLARAIRERAALAARSAHSAASARHLPVLLPRRRAGTPPILFLVHGRRGQAHVGPRFLELIGDDQPLYVFQARGVDGVQQPHPTLAAMAADYIDAMRKVQPAGPYLLAGLCSGSYVAVKMAELLHQRGERVAPLVLIDPPVPPFTREKAKQNLLALAVGLHDLSQRGDIAIDFNDPLRRQGAAAVAAHFEHALIIDQPDPYTGDVLLLATRSKIAPPGWSDPATLATRFAGNVTVLDVGEHHTEILDTSNELFAKHLRESIRHARAAIASQP